MSDERLAELCGRPACCSSVAQYIENHLDPDGVLTADDDPAEILSSLREVFPDLLLTVEEMAEYILTLELVE